MLPLVYMPEQVRRSLRGVLTDIDDTLSSEGRGTAAAYTALERLRAAGLLVIPVTGRPAGWCDHIARMWPVAGVGGENGASGVRPEGGAAGGRRALPGSGARGGPKGPGAARRGGGRTRPARAAPRCGGPARAA